MTDALLGVSVVFIQTLNCLQLNGVPLTRFRRLFIFAASLESVTRFRLTLPDIPCFYRFRSLYPFCFDKYLNIRVFKKIYMVVKVKIVCFQIIQNVLFVPKILILQL